MDNKKRYEEPSIEVIRMMKESVIRTSTGGGSGIIGGGGMDDAGYSGEVSTSRSAFGFTYLGK